MINVLFIAGRRFLFYWRSYSLQEDCLGGFMTNVLIYYSDTVSRFYQDKRTYLLQRDYFSGFIRETQIFIAGRLS